MRVRSRRVIAGSPRLHDRSAAVLEEPRAQAAVETISVVRSLPAGVVRHAPGGFGELPAVDRANARSLQAGEGHAAVGRRKRATAELYCRGGAAAGTACAPCRARGGA